MDVVSWRKSHVFFFCFFFSFCQKAIAVGFRCEPKNFGCELFVFVVQMKLRMNGNYYNYQTVSPANAAAAAYSPNLNEIVYNNKRTHNPHSHHPTFRINIEFKLV